MEDPKSTGKLRVLTNKLRWHFRRFPALKARRGAGTDPLVFFTEQLRYDADAWIDMVNGYNGLEYGTAINEHRRCPMLSRFDAGPIIGTGISGVVFSMAPKGVVVAGAPEVACKMQPLWHNNAYLARSELEILSLLMAFLHMPPGVTMTTAPAPFVKMYDFTACQVDPAYSIAAMTEPPKDVTNAAEWRRIYRARILVKMLSSDAAIHQRLMFAASQRFGKDHRLVTVDELAAVVEPFYESYFQAPMARNPVDLKWVIQVGQLMSGTLASFILNNPKNNKFIPAFVEAFFASADLFSATMAHVLMSLSEMAEAIALTHWDLHMDNILWQRPDDKAESVQYETRGKVYRVPLSMTDNRLFAIHDFGYAYSHYGRLVRTFGRHAHRKYDWPWMVGNEFNPAADLQRLAGGLLDMLFELLASRGFGSYYYMLVPLSTIQILRSMLRAGDGYANENVPGGARGYMAQFHQVTRVLDNIIDSHVNAPTREGKNTPPEAVFPERFDQTYKAACTVVWSLPLPMRHGDPTPDRVLEDNAALSRFQVPRDDEHTRPTVGVINRRLAPAPSFTGRYAFLLDSRNYEPTPDEWVAGVIDPMMIAPQGALVPMANSAAARMIAASKCLSPANIEAFANTFQRVLFQHVNL